jgi:molybdenum cofactor cytidylyltransferase
MSESTLFSIVLAAGESSRFGSSKQLAKIDGSTLVARAMRNAEAICGRASLLVAGRDWQDVAAACRPLQGFIVVNEGYAGGMASSIKAGVAAVSNVADGILVILADQPLVTPEHLAALVAAWRQTPGTIVASAYAGTSGPPLVFPRDFFGDLMSLNGDRGAKSIIDRNSDRLLTIEFEPAAVDIDRPADLEIL